MSKAGDDATDAITDLFTDLFTAWRTGSGPAQGVEGTHPELAALFSSTPLEFTFDRFPHREELPTWSWIGIDMPEVIDGTFRLYVPNAWFERQQQGPVAQLLTIDGRVRQSCLLTALDAPVMDLTGMTQRAQLLGFDYAPLADGFSRWVIVTRGAEAYWCSGIYQAGDWALAIKADAQSVEELEEQLAALTTSQPWYEWMPG